MSDGIVLLTYIALLGCAVGVLWALMDEAVAWLERRSHRLRKREYREVQLWRRGGGWK